jgi:lipopolysaccharide export system protein LptC
MIHPKYHANNPHLFLTRGFFVLFILLLTNCKSDMAEVESVASSYEPAKETGKDVELVFSEDGIEKIKLKAPSIIRYKLKDPYIEFPEGLEVFFYNETHEIPSTLKANYAIRYVKKKETVFKDDVRISNQKNEKVFTDEMIWDEKKGIIYSDRFVKVETPLEYMTGKGFEADQEFKSFSIKNPVGEVMVETAPGKKDSLAE